MEARADASILSVLWGFMGYPIPFRMISERVQQIRII